MATPVIICTPGGATDNCYITLANADLMFAGTLRETVWLASPAETRTRALIQATQDIEDLGGERSPYSPLRSKFAGAPFNVTQGMHFPRTSDYNQGGGLQIPRAIEQAVCEQALWLLSQAQGANDLVDHAALQAAGVRQISVDGLHVRYVESRGEPVGISPLAWVRIYPYIRRGFPTVAAHASVRPRRLRWPT